MGDPKKESARGGTIEIDEDLDHARAMWRVQRAGWLVMLLIVAAAVAGLFGDGPVAHARVGDDALRVEYDRFARHGQQTKLRAEVAPVARRGDTVRLWVDREFLQGVEVEAVTPEPASTEARADALWFTFLAPDSSRPTVITLRIRPDEYWSRRGRAGLEQGSSVAFRQFVYP
jgi:hypothetical protein